MRSAVFSGFFLLALSFATPASAKSAFFLQLGSAPSEQEAQTKWEKLQGDYPALLKNMEFTPRSVSAMGGGDAEFRIQAGPARSRDQAQRACSTLMSKDIECYIVETAVFDGEPSLARTTVSKASKVAEAAPEATETKLARVEEPSPAAMEKPAEPESKPEPAAEKSEKKESNFFSFLPWNDDEEDVKEAKSSEDKPAPMEEPKKEEPKPVAEEAPVPPPAPREPVRAASRVEIGEAIPVPLSIGEERAAPQPPQPMVKIATREVPLARNQRPRGETAEGKVTVSGFATEQAAFDFSNLLKSSLDNGKALRMQIMRSLQKSNGRGGVSLAVSPVANGDAAQTICDYAARQEAQLSCHTSSGDQLAQAPRTGGKDGWRPDTAAALASAPEQTASRSIFAGNPPSRYWVQLGSWRSQAEAVRRWQDLKAANKDVLKSMEPNVSVPRQVSIGAKPSVRLRAGPFDSRGEAESLCDRLSARGTQCLVVPE